MTQNSETPAKHAGGRPLDLETRQRILDAHRTRPDLDSHSAIAEAVGCTRRLVAAVLPAMRPKKPRGVRLVLAADLCELAREHSRLPADASIEEHLAATLRRLPDLAVKATLYNSRR